MTNAQKQKILDALNHVHSLHPDVTHVVYTSAHKWVYMDEDGIAPAFDKNGEVDIGLLEDASDCIEQLPCVFTIDSLTEDLT